MVALTGPRGGLRSPEGPRSPATRLSQKSRQAFVSFIGMFDSEVARLPATDVIGNPVIHEVHLGVPSNTV